MRKPQPLIMDTKFGNRETVTSKKCRDDFESSGKCSSSLQHIHTMRQNINIRKHVKIKDVNSKESSELEQFPYEYNHEMDINFCTNDLDFFQLDCENEKDLWKLIVKPDKDGDNLLLISIIMEKTVIATLFICFIPDFKEFSKFNRRYQTALHLAALTNNVTVARRLVVAGAEVEKRDMYGNTPLHIACKKGYIKVANALLTPVTFKEAQQNTFEIPFQRIPQNLEIRNAEGITCLMIAAFEKDKEIMDLLLSKDADINSFEMKSGKTSLHISAERGDTEMVKFILSKPSVKVDAKTYAGYSPSALAQSRGHHAVVMLLLYAGASPPEKLNDSDSDSDYQ